MASAKSIALRQEAAMQRIEDALKALHVRVGDGLRSPVADPEVRMANQLEVIAGALERAAGKQEKAAETVETVKPEVVEPVQDAATEPTREEVDAAVEQDAVETVETVETAKGKRVK